MTDTESATPGGAGAGPALGDAVELGESYAFEITAHYQDLEVSGQYVRGDTYHDIRMAGQQNVETYVVDGTSYVITSDVCLVDPQASSNPASGLDFGMTRVGTHEGRVEGHASVRPVGRTTFDGTEVYVYEITTQGVETTYYVAADSGLLRRYEQRGTQGDVTIEFHSWGSVDPIEPPDACPGADGTTTQDDSVAGPAFGDAVELVESYAFEITAHYQNLEMSGRYYRGDTYHDIRMAGQQNVESYVVDGASYVVTSGVCLADPQASSDPTSGLDFGMTRVGTHEGRVEGHASVRPVGRTTFDGTEVYVYEISTQGVQTTYYVATDSGLLRRYEQRGSQGDVTIEFHSWGSVDPIEPPDNCR